MNRKDFIKSLIAGSTILPTLALASKDKSMPLVVNPEIDAIYIKCESIHMFYEYDYGRIVDTIDGCSVKQLTGKSIELIGVGWHDINMLLSTMQDRPKALNFLIRVNSRENIALTGIISQVRHSPITGGFCKITYSKP